MSLHLPTNLQPLDLVLQPGECLRQHVQRVSPEHALVELPVVLLAEHLDVRQPEGHIQPQLHLQVGR